MEVRTIATGGSAPIMTTVVESPVMWKMVEQALFERPEHTHHYGIVSQARFLAQASEKSGGVVIISPHYDCLPILIGNDGEPVRLYELVEEWDSLTDYDDIQERFPTLSYMQVAGAIAFIRKITQFNSRQEDVDAFVSHEIESNPDFQQELRDALADREMARVLVADQ